MLVDHRTYRIKLEHMNTRLVALLEAELAAAKAMAENTGHPARRFKDFHWTTLDSWSRRRRVVAKAEWTQGDGNPRIVVTSLKRVQLFRSDRGLERDEARRLSTAPSR